MEGLLWHDDQYRVRLEFFEGPLDLLLYLVKKNEYDSYVLTMDKMKFEDDGSLVLKVSSQPEQGNWLYTPGGKMVLIIRAYQSDSKKIGSYIPPAFKSR